MQVVKKKYSSHAHQQFSFNFTFKEEFVSLDIPQTGLQLGEWKITPFYYPIVSSSPNVVVLLFVLFSEQNQRLSNGVCHCKFATDQKAASQPFQFRKEHTQM